MLTISGFQIQTTPDGERFLVSALSPNEAAISPETIPPEGKVTIVSRNGNFRWEGAPDQAVHILRSLNASTISLPHFCQYDGRLVLVIGGRQIDPIENNTAWWIGLAADAVGLSSEKVRQQFFKALEEKPWQTRQQGKRKNGNGRHTAVEKTVEKAVA
jgi:hypothetical protein